MSAFSATTARDFSIKEVLAAAEKVCGFPVPNEPAGPQVPIAAMPERQQRVPVWGADPRFLDAGGGRAWRDPKFGAEGSLPGGPAVWGTCGDRARAPIHPRTPRVP